ncbi:MAG: heavy metal translocating P-type ATPase metal-binding domain-containing protein [Chitinophagaceae bacterium]|nr:heavy metal translocating P-type ATPase metal-binding domain-containing protein [Chitinophagaceae bacterium]
MSEPIIKTTCYHCGEQCDEIIVADDKNFCCEGCKQVYLLLNENNLCSYYNFDKNPGIKAKGKFVSEKFAYLDDDSVIRKLIQFSNDAQTNVIFSLPQMHCSSCIFLLENLHRINDGIIKSQANFQRKEVFVIFDHKKISLRKVVELLAFIGYEPYISLNDTKTKKEVRFNKKRIYKIGVAGFCFSNIMMLSFPEYFSSGNIEQNGLKETFTWLNFGLSLPVLFFSASGFFVSAWKGLQQKFLNIDAPIALAILVTYGRSYYEIISGTGSGYLDSGTGIVFFMLIGRWFQDKTYDSFSFDRDYLSYFPLGVTVIKEQQEKNIPVTQIKKGDHIIIRHEEMIPADAVLLKGDANVDYSFVSGENIPLQKRKGELIYAGGKQIGGMIELEVVNETSQSYITQLWNNDIFSDKKNADKSFVHPWSRYFTMALFTVAISTAIYWWINEPSKILPAVTSVLIVACPCSLLLAATFTHGNMLRIFGKNKLYLKNASVIEAMADVDTIVFDKTGTLTQHNIANVIYEGTQLMPGELKAIKAVTLQSSHPLSKAIAGSINGIAIQNTVITSFKEHSGKGIEAMVDGIPVRLGNTNFIRSGGINLPHVNITGPHVHVVLNNIYLGTYKIGNQYREGLNEMCSGLAEGKYGLHILSGDNNAEKTHLKNIFNNNVNINFEQQPQQKLDYIKQLQLQHKHVMMLGDGLNDAGALKQSNVGIAVSENHTQFTPASDAILDGSNVHLTGKFLEYARSGKKIVTAIFIVSILYNIVGLFFATQALLSPMVAAILMPASSISIVILAAILSSASANMKGL